MSVHLVLFLGLFAVAEPVHSFLLVMFQTDVLDTPSVFAVCLMGVFFSTTSRTFICLIGCGVKSKQATPRHVFEPPKIYV